MHTIRVVTPIQAPIERCFDLARSIDLHLRSTERTRERAVAGVTSGLIGPGQSVTWEATHLGVRQRLTSRMRTYDRPHHFRDTLARGVFRQFDHDHVFEPAPAGTGDTTWMTDIVTFAAPLGPVGWLVERVLLGWYLRRFLRQRAEVIKQVAELNQWRQYLPPA